MRISPDDITELQPDEVFVFGSNLAGLHGGGAARFAMQRLGAVWGKGVGLQGQSYAIPTMQGGVETIKPYVDRFIAFARENPHLKFLVTEIGCGIAGFTPEQIAPLFAEAVGIANIWLPTRFLKVLQKQPSHRANGQPPRTAMPAGASGKRHRRKMARAKDGTGRKRCRRKKARTKGE